MEYVKPQLIRIGRNKETERLYILEHDAHETFKKAVKEWMKVTHTPDDQFWTVALPQMLYDWLESWDNRAAMLAAKFYLETKKEQ